ncbi:hypothetical protein [Pseudomonas sp. O230]
MLATTSTADQHKRLNDKQHPSTGLREHVGLHHADLRASDGILKTFSR